MQTIRAAVGGLAIRLAFLLAPEGSQARKALADVVTTLGSGGVGPWRPR